MLVVLSCFWIAGEHRLSQREVDSTNLASSGLMPPVDATRKRKFPADPQDGLKSSLFLEMVQGELNLDVIAGIWPEVSSSTQEIVCLSLSKHFWLCLLKSFI